MNPWPRTHLRRLVTRHRTRRRATSAAAGAAAVVALIAVTACVGPGKECIEIGGTNIIIIDVAPAVRADLNSLRVELCQPEGCGDVTFPTATPSEPNTVVQDGVSFIENTYSVDLRALGDEWDADAESRVTVRGDSANGTEVVQRSESFRFDRNYPNGRGCDPETLSHRTRIDDRDRSS